MSMTTNLIEQLREYSAELDKLCSPSDSYLVKRAADTIEELSAKVAQQNMEKSSQYYNGGWIPVDERLPTRGEKVLVWYEYYRYGNLNGMFQTYGIGFWSGENWGGDVSGTKARCIAWRPLPTAYEPKEG